MMADNFSMVGNNFPAQIDDAGDEERERHARREQRARLIVCGSARDAIDARFLLEMLGLIGSGVPT